MACILNNKSSLLNFSDYLDEKGATKKGSPWTVVDLNKAQEAIRKQNEAIKYYAPEIPENISNAAEIAKSETKLLRGSSFMRDNIKTTYKIKPNKEFFDFVDKKRKELGIYDSKLAFSEYFRQLKEQDEIIAEESKPKVKGNIKPGVEKLFESNPELANQVYEALGFKTKPDVILPIGTSGSGKSTFIKSLPQENLVVIEPDTMRIEFTGDINDKSKDEEIYKEAAKRAIVAIKNGKQVVFDTTNLTKDKRLPFIEAIKKEIPSANIQYKLMELNPELAKQRIKAQITRGENRANVSDSTIDRHAESYKQMLEDIKSEPIGNFEITPQQKQQALQLYSQYLDTIFPDSKVKDIVYHGTDRVFEQFSKNIEKVSNREILNTANAYFFTNDLNRIKDYGRNRINAILNVKESLEFKNISNDRARVLSDITYEKAKGYTDRNINSVIADYDLYKDYIVFEPEQIHILGNKQDIEGFKEFVGNKPLEFQKDEEIFSPEMLEIVKNNHPQLQDGATQLEIQFFNNIKDKNCK